MKVIKNIPIAFCDAQTIKVPAGAVLLGITLTETRKSLAQVPTAAIAVLASDDIDENLPDKLEERTIILATAGGPGLPDNAVLIGTGTYKNLTVFAFEVFK